MEEINKILREYLINIFVLYAIINNCIYIYFIIIIINIKY